MFAGNQKKVRAGGLFYPCSGREGRALRGEKTKIQKKKGVEEERRGGDFKRGGGVWRSIAQGWDVPSRPDIEYSVLRVGAGNENKSDRKRGFMIY